MAKQIKAYQSEDGAIFKSKSKAEKHDIQLLLENQKDELEEFLYELFDQDMKDLANIIIGIVSDVDGKLLEAVEYAKKMSKADDLKGRKEAE